HISDNMIDPFQPCAHPRERARASPPATIAATSTFTAAICASQNYHPELISARPPRLFTLTFFTLTSGAAMMICDRRTVLALVGSVVFVGTAVAKHNHNNGQQLVGNKLGTNGKHEIHKVGEHTVSVQIENKKVAGVSVTHRTKGNVAVKKYKTNKKMAQGSEIDAPAETNGHLVQLADYQVAQAIVYIGYSFFDGIDEQIYWFPAEMVVDPFTGAVDYVPLA